MKTLYVVLLFVTCNLFSQPNQYPITPIQLDSIFGRDSATFLLYNTNKNEFLVHNPEHAQIAFSVHSTSKILWSIIALEEGIIKDKHEVMSWDSLKYPNVPAW